MLKYSKLIIVIILLAHIGFLKAQCISGDCNDGKGTYIYPSGAKYVGDFKDGEIDGIGVCYYTDGSKYSGEWRSRYPEGKGTRTYADGSKRSGLWKRGRPTDEKGKFIEDVIVAKGERNNDGTDIQSGCISGDCNNGNGIFAYPDGSKYEGQFLNGKIDGWGTWYFSNNDKYVGAFHKNLAHGKGTIYHANGTTTTGEWVEGEYRGNSVIEHGRFGCIDGDCINGHGTYVYKDGAAKYVGTFKDSLPFGKGTVYYANGERYAGNWENGLFNGFGILYRNDGSEVSGYWDFGTYMGKNPDEETLATINTEKVEHDGIADVGEQTVKPKEKEQSNNKEEKQETAVDTTALAKIEEEIPSNKTDTKQIIKEKIPDLVKPDLKVWAVVIGVSSYNHMPMLRYTDDDAYRFFAFLKSPEGGAIPDEQIKVLIDEDATKENITNTMISLFGKAGKNDLIMLYFSGHGLQGSFLPIDYDGFNNKLGHDEINQLFEKSPAKYKLCIADACHSGSLLAMKGTNAESALSNYYRTLANAEAGTALIMSSKSEENSLESSGLRQGVFSHFLIRGLKGEADKDSDKVVTVQELYDFINVNVRDYTGNRQSPVIKGNYDPKMTISVMRD